MIGPTAAPGTAGLTMPTRPLSVPDMSIAGLPRVGFIGAGSFAQSYLIPNVKSFGASLDTVVTSKGITSKNVGDKFGFNSCSDYYNRGTRNISKYGSASTISTWINHIHSPGFGFDIRCLF